MNSQGKRGKVMKKLGLVLMLAMVALSFSVNSYALDFRGLRLRMSEEEVCKWLEIKPPAFKSDVMDMAGRKLLGDGVNYANVLIIDERVVKITVSIYQDESEAYRQALHKKYGKPLTSKQVPYQNNFGVKFMGLEEHWKIGKDHIWFAIRPESVGKFDTVLIFETDEWYQLEHKKPEPKL
jgi:hypothetical protein